MKRFTLTFVILCALCAVTYSGTEQYSGKDKEVLQPAPPPCEWYRAHEWNMLIWGTYAWAANQGRDHIFEFEDEDVFVDIEANADHLINKDDTWGGGGDIKYFFNKYMGIGIQGFVLAARNTVGAGLTTFTFRYPIGCSRFAPYAWGGFGFIAGGSNTEHLFVAFDDGETAFEFSDKFHSQNKHVEPIYQFGGGMEVRITRPSDFSKIAVGVMADVAWNIVDDPNNNFGMARLGLSLAY